MFVVSRFARRIAVLLVITALTIAISVPTLSSAHSQRSGHASPLVKFPADQAGHPGSQNEWWYVVGHLKAGARTFGYELTIFKFHNVTFSPNSSPLSIYRTDVAITDEQGRKFFEQITPYFTPASPISTTALDVRVGSAFIQGPTPQSMKLHAVLPRGGFTLNLASTRPPMFVGGKGYVPFADGFTYYYSLTDLSTAGSLQLNGKTFHVVGTSWLDHQWGNWNWTGINGWSWMGIQLDNGVQLSVFDFHSTSGRLRAASVLTADGKLRTQRDARISSSATWHSPHSGANYPSAWTVHIPKLHVTLQVAPTVRDQELIFTLDPRGSYWEGSCRVQGTWNGKPVTGLSYTELTGFAT
jgi:predicted secreted hydrolase